MSLDQAVRRLFPVRRINEDPQQQDPSAQPPQPGSQAVTPQQAPTDQKPELPTKPAKYHLKKHPKPQKGRLPWEKSPGDKSVKESHRP